jgi:pimeloyl-ACP methyl ester carboxylesterase
MRALFVYYQSFLPQDAIENQNYSKTKLTMPVLALAASYSPVFGGNVSMSGLIYGMKILAQSVHGIIVPNSGHWIPEEQPQFVIKQLSNFFGGSNPTKTSK